MDLRILIDMNLSPDRVPYLRDAGIGAAHWSTIGDPRAPDETVLRWAEANAHVVFTHDLDFGTLLALTRASGPSVIQVRAGNPAPDAVGVAVLAAIRGHVESLMAGAWVVVDPRRARVRLLPLS